MARTGQPHLAEFCENGVKAVAEEATTERITPAFFADHSIAELRERSEHWLGQQGRLTEPMVKRSGGTHYEPIAWDDAFAMIADELVALPVARRRRVLHVGPHEQRSRVPLPAARPVVRHEQPARLLEHVPRGERQWR